MTCMFKANEAIILCLDLQGPVCQNAFNLIKQIFFKTSLEFYNWM